MASRVLFVCRENANRSQMAEAFCRRHGAGRVEAASAGSQPAAAINPRAKAAMAEKGYDLAGHFPKPLSAVADDPYDAVVTMGCGDSCPFVRAFIREDWDLPDPRDLEPAAYAQVRDVIEARVLDLLQRLAGSGTAP
ncbi:MAG: arsenate reductase ArsC [Thermodesulfobacteriota bacterium]